MINRPAFHSNEDLVTHLQGLIRSVPTTGTVRPDNQTLRLVREIAEELADRIYDHPQEWGLAGVPADVRDDVALDALSRMLFDVLKIKGKRKITDRFADLVQARVEELHALKDSDNHRTDQQIPAHETSEPGAATPPIPPEHPLFDDPEGVWSGFEQQFQRDAYTLRLRYLLHQSHEEMAETLKAPSPRAIKMRLTRARDRFAMYCHQQGLDQGTIDSLLESLSEETER